MDTKRLYREGLEHHLDLFDDQQRLIALGKLLTAEPSRVQVAVEGNEAVLESLKEGGLALGSGLFEMSKWVGGKTVGVFASALGMAGNGLVKAFANNDTLIKRLVQGVGKVDDHEVKVSKDKAAAITSSGSLGDLGHDMDTLLRSLEILYTHNRDLLAYLDKQLLVARKLKSAKTSDAVLAITEEFENLKYPVFSLPKHNGDVWASDTLPGGRVWNFTTGDGKSPKYLMNGDTPTGAEATETMSKSEVSALLTKLDKINGMHKRVKQSYDSYLSFIKSWADMVKAVDGNLSELDQVSKTAHSEAEKLLAGDPHALAFYSGFTPRVVSYTDRYIHGVLGVFA